MGEVVRSPWGACLLTTYDLCDQVLRSRSWVALDSEWRLRQGEGNRWSAPASRELGQALQGLNPPEHTRQRRSLGNLFDRKTLGRLRGPVARLTHEILDAFAERLDAEGEADFAEEVGEQLPVAAVGHWLGIPHADYDLLRSLAHNQAYAQELLPTSSQLEKANEATFGLRAYFTELVRERRRNPGEDVISSWIRIWDAGEPDRDRADETVYFLAMFLVIAALETTSTLLSSMVWILHRHPEQLAWLRGHPQEVPGAVEEIMRYDPPVHITTRAASQDTTLGGVPVAKDQLVHVMIASANHDPARISDPDTLDIRRAGTSHLGHLAFGGGIHYCIGAGLARQQASILLDALLRRFPSLRVTSPPRWEPRVAFRRLVSLPVALR